MRYTLPVDRLVNQLTPHFWGGRKYILLLQSLLYPLKSLNDDFLILADKKKIEAKMTSQVIYFEWFLNYRFKKYFVDQNEKITISDSIIIGTEINNEDAINGIPFTVWFSDEIATVSDEEEKPKPLFASTEEKSINQVSFKMNVPAININQLEFVYMLSCVVNTYKIAGKTYHIIVNGTPNIPINTNK